MATVLKQPAPEYGSIGWFRESIAVGASEKSMHPVNITPSIATQLLMLNTKNRSIKPRKVEQLRRSLAAGLFRGMNGETIKFKKDGALGDGQHRLTAIAAEGRDVMTYVMFGAEDADIDTVDQGAARTAADIVRLAGGEHAPERAAIGRLLIAYEETGGASLNKRSAISNSEVVRRVDNDPRIMEAAQWVSTYGRRAPGVPGSSVALCYYLFSAIHREDAEKYLIQVCDGVNLQPRDPAMTVRDYLIRRVKKDQRAQAIKLEAILRGWNAFREGRSHASVSTNGTLPELI